MLEITDSIIIDRHSSEVLPWLVEGERLAKWWPIAAESECREGGKLVFVWANGSRLETHVTTFISEHISFPFGDEHVDFFLSDDESSTKLTVKHSNISPEPIEHVIHIAQSWAFLLCNLKSVMERGWDLRPSWTK